MSIILLIGFFMSIFLIALLIGKKNKMIVDKVFLSVFAVYAITIGGTYVELYNVENNFPYPHFMNVNWLFLLLHGPLLWYYVKSLTTLNFRIKPFHLLHFAPFLIYLIIHSIDFIQLSAEAKILLIRNEAFTSTIMFKIGSMTVGISSIGYNIVALFLLQKHLKNIKNTFSNIEDKELKWLKILVVASLIIFTINVLLYNLNNYFKFSEYFAISKIAYSFSTVYVFFIGYFGVKQGRIFIDNPSIEFAHSIEKETKDESTQPLKKDYSNNINRLILLMEQEQPYLDPELSLLKLSLLLKIKPEQLSEILNATLNQNFFDFVNKYRIEEFKVKCLNQQNKHLSIMGIAYDCGFNSKAAFYRAFNKFEGISPTAYISKVS